MTLNFSHGGFPPPKSKTLASMTIVHTFCATAERGQFKKLLPRVKIQLKLIFSVKHLACLRTWKAGPSTVEGYIPWWNTGHHAPCISPSWKGLPFKKGHAPSLIHENRPFLIKLRIYVTQ